MKFFGLEHFSLKIQYIEFDMNVPLPQQYIKNVQNLWRQITHLHAIIRPHRH